MEGEQNGPSEIHFGVIMLWSAVVTTAFYLAWPFLVKLAHLYHDYLVFMDGILGN